MPDVAVVTDTTHYLPRETVAELGIREVSLYVNDGERQEREADIVDFTAFYDAPAHRRHAADHLAAVDRRLPRRLRAAGAPTAATSSRSTSRAGSRARSSPRARRRPSSAASGGAASRSSTRKLACGGARHGRRWPPRRSRAPAADVDAVAARAREAADATRLWFAVDTLEYLRRGGRIGAGPGLAGRRAEDQADPHLRRRDRRRSSACAPRAARSSGWSTTCARATTTAPTAGSSSTSRRPSVGRAPGRRRARDLRHRAAVRLGDRAGHRRPRRPGPARRRRHPAGAAGRVGGAVRRVRAGTGGAAPRLTVTRAMRKRPWLGATGMRRLRSVSALTHTDVLARKTRCTVRRTADHPRRRPPRTLPTAAAHRGGRPPRSAARTAA